MRSLRWCQFRPVVGRRSIPGAKVQSVGGGQSECWCCDIQVGYDSGQELLLGFFGEFQDCRKDGILAAGVSVYSTKPRQKIEQLKKDNGIFSMYTIFRTLLKWMQLSHPYLNSSNMTSEFIFFME